MSLPTLNQIEISANTERYCTLLRDTKRDGVDALIAYLATKTDFFKAPASARYHSNEIGGLCDHSLHVFDLLSAFVDASKAELDHNAMIISALLHDICKANFYIPEQKWRKDENNRWESYETWGVKEKFPMGHGDKSAFLAAQTIKLTPEEALAIRWHMGPWEQAVHNEHKFAFNEARSQFFLVVALQLADEWAAQSEKVYEF